MITGPLNANAYLYLTPRWSFEPMSGAGAAARGGRFNRPGVPALYLSLETETATAEFTQAAAVFDPGTLASYSVRLANVVDFRSGYARGAWDPLWEEWNCEWKRLWFIEKIEPPTWELSDWVQEAGLPGLLFPSTKLAGGVNLVVYTDLLSDPDSVRVFDPRQQLPNNALSWEI